MLFAETRRLFLPTRKYLAAFSPAAYQLMPSVKRACIVYTLSEDTIVVALSTEHSHIAIRFVVSVLRSQNNLSSAGQILWRLLIQVSKIELI